MQITGNTISGNEYSGPGSGSDPVNSTQSAGILLLPAANGSLVDSNIVDANDIGIYTSGTGITVSNNQLGNTAANRHEGIYVDEGSATVSGNSIKGGEIGIALVSFNGSGGNSSAAITGNTISNATTGVSLLDETPHNNHTAVTSFSGNTLTGETTYIFDTDGASGELVASGTNVFDGVTLGSNGCAALRDRRQDRRRDRCAGLRLCSPQGQQCLCDSEQLLHARRDDCAGCAARR